MKYKIQTAAEFCKTAGHKHEIVELIDDATKCLKAKNFESAHWRIQRATAMLETKNAKGSKC